MSQVMSPLGAVCLKTTAANPGTSSPTNSISNNSTSSHEDQVLKLMSVGLLSESSRALDFHHSLALTLATANCRSPKMTFKSSGSGSELPEAPHHRQIHHHQQLQLLRPDPISTTNPFIDHPEEFHSRTPNSSPRDPTTNDGRSSPGRGESTMTAASPLSSQNMMNDEDEVLSIGRDDDQILLDCDSSLMSDEEEVTATTTTSPTLQEQRNGRDDDDPGPVRPDNENSSGGGSGSDLTSNPSPSPPTFTHGNNNFLISHSRIRNYSSEDCSSVKSLPFVGLSSLSEAILKQNSRQQSQLPNQTPFSIANILRPDFGVCKIPPMMILPPKATIKPRRHHLNPNPNTNKRPAPINPNPPGSLSLTPGHHHNNNKIQRRHEPIIPIDLSRPGSNGTRIPLPQIPAAINGRHKSSGGSNHQRKSIIPQPGRENESKSKSAVSPAVTTSGGNNNSPGNGNKELWPAWVYCTRYSDRPSSGPRSRRGRKKEKEIDEKRPRTAFTADQLSRLKKEFDENRYLTERRRQDLARDLRLHENQIKIWFQNKRAKLKKSSGQRGGLAMQLMAQGLYNHSTIQTKGCGQDEDDSD